MSDPVMVAMAAAIAGKAVEEVSAGGKAAITALARLVRRKLRADPESRTALESARADPRDEDRLTRLATALEEAARRDPSLTEELDRLRRALREHPTIARHGGVVNQMPGTVRGPVVQTRDVGGGISIVL